MDVEYTGKLIAELRKEKGLTQKQLAEEGIRARVLDMHTIKPLDEEAVNACIDDCGRIITVEDHNILNGLGSAVAEVIAERGKGKLKRIGVQDQFGQAVLDGDAEEAYARMKQHMERLENRYWK